MRNANAFQTLAKVSTIVAALWAAPLHAQVVSLTPNQVIALAVDGLRNDNPEQAAIAMDAYLQQFPDDPTGLLLRTEAAILLQDFAGATSFGQQAFWNAANNGQRFNAARLIALGHASQMQDSRAQLWLRAARQFAPNEAASESVARDFAAVRQRNPLSVSLRFGIAPSSNINGGTFNDTIDINFFGSVVPFDLSEDAQAQSGWEVYGSTSLRYRLNANQTSATFLDASVTGTTYLLSQTARENFEGVANDERAALRTRLEALTGADALTEEEIAQRLDDEVDEITGSDFSFARVRVGASHIFALAPDIGFTDVGLHFSRTIRKDKDERNALTASLSHRYSLTDTSSISVSGVSERQQYVVGNDQIQTFRVQATYSQAIGNVGSFSFGYGVERTEGDRSSDEYDAETYTLGFSPADPILGTDLSLGLTYREIDWDLFDSFNGARSDEVVIARLTATFRDFEVFGFNPVMSIEHENRKSTATRYQTDGTTLSFDIVSSF